MSYRSFLLAAIDSLHLKTACKLITGASKSLYCGWFAGALALGCLFRAKLLLSKANLK